MDKSWINLCRTSDEYISGVRQFLDYAFEKGAIGDQIACPCVKCCNGYWYTREEVFEHLIVEGFTKGYVEWVYHGEVGASYNINTNSSGENDFDGLLNDMFWNATQTSTNSEEGHRSGVNDEAKRFYTLLEEAQSELYPGCKNFSTLSFTIRLYLLKCLHGWSNASFTSLLELLKEAMPTLRIPESFNKAKKMVKDLGLDYKKIDACPNDCMLYWKEYENMISCHVCGSSRWKSNEDLQCDGDNNATTNYKIPAKVLWHFPLVPRLQRLFMCSKTAKLMRWHEESHSMDGKLRHPCDGQAWKLFNSRYMDFSHEARNIRLGLAADGFNPHKTKMAIWKREVSIYVEYLSTKATKNNEIGAQKKRVEQVNKTSIQRNLNTQKVCERVSQKQLDQQTYADHEIMIAEKVVNKEKASKGTSKFAKASSQRDNLEVKKVHHQTVSTQQIENPPNQEGMHTGRFIGDENLWMQSEQEVGEEQYDEQHNFSIDRATLIEDYETAGPSRKRTRGATECKTIHIRSVADRKLVTFNVHGQPIGPDEATVKELSLFLGTLARNSVTCPLIHTSWKKLPMEKKISMWKYVNLKYILPPNAKTWVLSDISNSWRCYKSRVKAKHFTKYQNDEERWKNRPIKIPGDHFKSLLKYWKREEVKETSDRNIRNRIS